MIKAIFAVDPWGGMGHQGSLPWPHCSEDLQYFKTQTKGDIVIMGRHTWDDPKMPKPLPDRITYVVTNRPIAGYYVTCIKGDIASQLQSIQAIYPKKNIWIIGGPELIMSCKDHIDEAHITHFKNQYRADVKIDLKKFLLLFRPMSARPSLDGRCSWMVYKNIDIFKKSVIV